MELFVSKMFFPQSSGFFFSHFLLFCQLFFYIFYQKLNFGLLICSFVSIPQNYLQNGIFELLPELQLQQLLEDEGLARVISHANGVIQLGDLRNCSFLACQKSEFCPAHYACSDKSWLHQGSRTSFVAC